MYMFISLSALAGGLDVERAVTALHEGRPAESVTYARTAIEAADQDAEAWTIYLQACDGAGIGVACRAEASVTGGVAALMALRLDRLGGVKVEAPEIGSPEERLMAVGKTEGVDHALALRERLKGLALADPDAAAELALQVLDQHPDRPDILAGLFADKVPPMKSIGKARKKAVKMGQKRLRSASPAELYRWLALWIATDAHELATQTADLLEAAGEARPLDRKPLTRGQQVRLAEAIVKGTAKLPVYNPTEYEALALKVHRELGVAGRLEQAATSLTEARQVHDTVSLAIAEAEALLTLKEYTAAKSSAEQAVGLATAQWPTDLAFVSADVRRQAVAISIALRGRIELDAGDKRNAAVDLMLANQLALRPVDAGALEHAMKAAHYELETMKAQLETAAEPVHVRGMALARSAETPTEAIEILDRTVAALCLPSLSKARLTARLATRPFIAEALALRSTFAQQAGDLDAARNDLVVAVLLRPYTAPADWWADLAVLRATPEAAFFADAMATALDEERDPTKNWPGRPGSSPAAAAALVSQWMRGAPAKPTGATITRGVVIAIPQGGRSSRPGRAPALHAPFPAFQLSTPHGEVSLRRGRMALITFFRADSPNSRRAIRELTVLAQHMRRKRSIDVFAVGVSVDPDESNLTALGEERDTWGPNGWNPEMGERFGITAVPTTFVVDGDGVARFVHVGYLGTSEYEAELMLLGGN